jgi:hypothetical protein
MMNALFTASTAPAKVLMIQDKMMIRASMMIRVRTMTPVKTKSGHN